MIKTRGHDAGHIQEIDFAPLALEGRSVGRRHSRLTRLPDAGQAAAQQTKLSQALSKYQDTPKNGQQCSTCSHFVAPASCAIVVDPIAPQGWCQFYAKP